MTDAAAITTFIDIRARNFATVEFQKVAQESKKASQEIGRGFKGVAKEGIADAVQEIKSFVRAFGLIKVGKELFALIAGFVETQRSIAEARRELDLFAAYTGTTGAALGEQFDKLRALGLSPSQSNAILQLAAGFGMAKHEIMAAAKEALILSTTTSGYAGDPVRALRDMEAASEGFRDSLAKATNLEINSQQRFIDFRRNLGTYVQQRWDVNEASSWAETERIKAEINRVRSEFKPIPARDPLSDEKAKRDAKALRDMEEAMRGQRKEERELATERKENMRETIMEAEIMMDAARGVGDAWGNALAGLATGAMSAKEAFRAFVSDMIRMISRLIAEFIALAIARSLAGAGVSQGAPYRESLGREPVPGGGPLALPGSLGMGGGGGGGGNVINIYANDAKSFEAQLARSQKTVVGLNMDANNRMGAFRKSFGTQGRLR